VTAQRAALRRASHQVLDDPPVFIDPWAATIVGAEDAATLSRDPRAFETRWSLRLRAFLVARSCVAEETLARCVSHGTRAYVVLGAGLDTFAYRNPHEACGLRTFEVDHPTTQAWKKRRLSDAGIPVPSSVTFVPVDFETHSLEAALGRAGVPADQPALFSWLGVTPYLSRSAVIDVLAMIAKRGPGSAVVFDFSASPSTLDAIGRRAFDGLAQRLAAEGEPWITFFDPREIEDELRAVGYRDIEVFDPRSLNARYFSGRSDKLAVGKLGYVVRAIC
jgi:methyltransferase (TIGR00027 family)